MDASTPISPAVTDRAPGSAGPFPSQARAVKAATVRVTRAVERMSDLRVLESLLG